jgi:hypothetical protein
LSSCAGPPEIQPEYLLAVVGYQLDVVVAWVRQRLAAQLREPVVGRQVRIADQSPESRAPGSRVQGGNPIGIAAYCRTQLHPEMFAGRTSWRHAASVD